MASPRVRAVALYLRGKRAATIKTAEPELAFNGSPLIGAEGMVGHSTGTGMCRIRISGFTPVSGSAGTEILDMAMRQDDINVGFIVGGKFLKQDMKIMNMSWSSDTESGMVTENLQLEGPLPKVTG